VRLVTLAMLCYNRIKLEIPNRANLDRRFFQFSIWEFNLCPKVTSFMVGDRMDTDIRVGKVQGSGL
jgi:ribonucleotide monophosphatase NagD (HAD superfamily)